MKIFSSSFLSILIISSICFAQWENVNFNGIGIPKFINAIDSETAIIATYQLFPDRLGLNYLYFTENGGETWLNLNWPENYLVNDISSISLEDIWIAADSAIYYHSARENKWELKINFSTGYEMINIEMFDELNGIACCEDWTNKSFPIFIKTNDGGETWEDMNNNNFEGGWAYKLRGGISFVDSAVGYYMPFIDNDLADEFLYKTMDGGSTWEQTNFNNEMQFGHWIKFVNRDVGYINYQSGEPNTLHRTTDGGKTWKNIYTTNFNSDGDGKIGVDLNDASFVVFAFQHSIIISKDTGNTWYTYDMEDKNFNGCNDISLVDNNIGWVVDQVGEIFKCDNMSIITKIDESEKVINDFILFQNYPNPFNPTTTIKYTIPFVETGYTPFLQMTVYDILGNEIAVLIDEHKLPGKYELEFDGSKLSSGVYYYQLSYGNFIKTRKMLLLK